ncbi:phytanoyl-CoA dioxygenase family protein [Pseudoalteromonas luteoviolacea]|uniref:phytanoyl-CoA dioxygenase family protein n=1 Tax=Pseudoalteromonas luteoviolacea TaxID=43657 RepID=UPI001F387F1D|nr:phytanoyl-CoA dioxygenase family protein [Pseudoalteromonas luteoviolacea]MCF6439365.1 phytanoyl-CoA dioxygenase family protein [Pseudoalteromonas luteoviolacea]
MNNYLEQYKSDGFVIINEGVIESQTLDSCMNQIPLLMNNIYETGIPPRKVHNLGQPDKVIKYDQVHRSSIPFYELIKCKNLKIRLQALVGSNSLKVLATQLIIKPPSNSEGANIGWHTDDSVWNYLQGEVFTIWVPLTNVNEKTGTLEYVQKSHKDTHSFSKDDVHLTNMQTRENCYSINQSKIVKCNILKGGFSIHHRNSVHGSRNNTTDSPRVAFAIHVMTENVKIVPGLDDFGLAQNINSEIHHPTIY